MERFSQSVSSETEGDLAHTQLSITCASPSQVGEQCHRSRYVSAQSYLRGIDGTSRKFDPGKGVVNTPLCVTGPRAPLRSNLDDPEEWELPRSVDESVCWGEAHRTELVACRPIIKCGRQSALGLVLSLRWNMGTQLGKSQPRARPAGKHSRVLKSLSQIPRLPKVKG